MSKYSVPKLYDMCQEVITSEILALPPLLQERILKTTKEQMREKIEKEVRKDILDELTNVPVYLSNICRKVTYNEYLTALEIEGMATPPKGSFSEYITYDMFDSIAPYINRGPRRNRNHFDIYTSSEDDDY